MHNTQGQLGFYFAPSHEGAITGGLTDTDLSVMPASSLEGRMARQLYTVQVMQQGNMVEEYAPMVLREAVKTAERIAHPKNDKGEPVNCNYEIFISFYRASDGQTGYYNPSEGHSPIGRDWAR